MPQRRLPPLAALRAFETAARLSSFKLAANELAVTPAAISQQIRALEAEFQFPLFIRKARSVELTEKGQMLSRDLSVVFAQLADAVEKVRQSDRPELSISTTPAIASKWLTYRLQGFTKRHPELSAEISAETQVNSLDDQGSNVAVRFGNAPGDQFYSELLCHEVFLPLTSPELVRRLSLSEASDLVRAPLIHDHTPSHVLSNIPTWGDWFKLVHLNPRDANRGTRFVAAADQAMASAIAGSGVVLGRLGLAFDDLKHERLVCPFGPMIESQLGYYLVCRKGQETRECIRTFFDWIRQDMTEGLAVRSEFLKKFDTVSDVEMTLSGA